MTWKLSRHQQFLILGNCKSVVLPLSRCQTDNVYLGTRNFLTICLHFVVHPEEMVGTWDATSSAMIVQLALIVVLVNFFMTKSEGAWWSSARVCSSPSRPSVSNQNPSCLPNVEGKMSLFLGAPDERFHFSVAKAGDHWGFATFHIIPFIESWCFNRIGPAGSLQRTELLSAVASALLALVSMGPCCQVHWSIRVSRVSRFWAPGPDPNFSRKPIWIIIKGIP